MTLLQIFIVGIFLLRSDGGASRRTPAALSEETQACIDCHEQYTPGIVGDWRMSRHSTTSPEEALAAPEIERRISASSIPPQLEAVAVGCYECHSRNPALHHDRFDHFGYKINLVVSPGDCRTCHPAEVEQYGMGKKPYALDNLQKNPVFHTLVEVSLRTRELSGGHLLPGRSDNSSKNETCYACHGTRVEVAGSRTISTDAGEIVVPRLTNWPNQGVGRINPDGTSGACTSCHPRHSFSLAVARKPSTCGQCHLEPDVPAYNIYKESKHGNIFESAEHGWTWDAVPWTVGKDFTAPTCAACHNSLLVSEGGARVADRSHDFGARTWVRVFGLITSHPQPRTGKTYEIRNADGMPLPTTFAGEPARTGLLNAEEQSARKARMTGVCSACHGSSWIRGYFAEFDTSIADADRMVVLATQVLSRAWKTGLADQTNPFDESIEQRWVRQWLFYANSVRYASAMSGPDYAAFKNGWWELTTNLQQIQETVVPPRKAK